MDYTERTFIMVKPDGVQRGLVNKIIKRFETKGFKLVAMKFMWVSELCFLDMPQTVLSFTFNLQSNFIFRLAMNI